MSGPVGQLFSKLTAVVASPASSVQNHHKIVIDRKTIEKTWKYMDKVRFKFYFEILNWLGIIITFHSFSLLLIYLI